MPKMVFVFDLERNVIFPCQLQRAVFSRSTAPSISLLLFHSFFITALKKDGFIIREAFQSAVCQEGDAYSDGWS